MIPEVKAHLKSLSSEVRDRVLALREIILQTVPGVLESVVWRSLSYHRPQVGGRVKGAVCQIVVKGTQVRLDFIHGIRLADPADLLTGHRKSKRSVLIETVGETTRPQVVELIRQAGALDPTAWSGTPAAAGNRHSDSKDFASVKSQAPSQEHLANELGAAQEVWARVIASISEKLGPIDQEWKPSKSSFGWMCLLKSKKKTLLYLTPDKQKVQAAIVLGERAVSLALASELPERIKSLIREARSYAEGRGIRFPIRHAADVRIIKLLVALKTTPQ